jgi:hypothetical protein
MTIGKQGNVVDTKIRFQAFFKPSMLLSIISEPMAIPKILDFLDIFLKGGHGRTRDKNRHGQPPTKEF